MQGVSLQLYSVRSSCKEDFYGTLKKIAALGYKGVEFAGNYGDDVKKTKELMDSLGLKVSAAHVNTKDMTAETFEKLKILGCKTIFNPALKVSEYTEENMKEVCNTLIDCKRMADENGFEFGYHNHDFEFLPYNGEPAIYEIAKRTKDAGVFFEIDVFWAEYAGYNFEKVLRDFEGRLLHIHLKDIIKATKENVPTGTGDIDFKKVIEIGKSFGCEWVTVEHEPKDKDKNLISSEQELKNIEDCINGIKNLL